MSLGRFVLTGGIASGKSAAADFFREAGWGVLDADDIVHALLDADESVINRVREMFGSSVLTARGTISRVALAPIVFSDPDLRRGLEAILHPAVKEKFAEWFSSGGDGKIAVVPLLFETGWEKEFDTVVCIASALETQLDRLINSRGFSPEDAQARLAAQFPVERKTEGADFVIRNDGTLGELRRKVLALSGELKGLHN